MSLIDTVARVRAYLEVNARMSYRMIKREFALSDEDLDELIDELVDIQQVARREPKALAWSAAASNTATLSASAVSTPEPRSYTPKHLADKILNSRAALEGERKQVTVLFADIKGSMDLAVKLDPEEWHDILDRFFAILADGVHRYEGTINQYTGDGIMALFGAPIAHEDHAQRACYAALQLRDDLGRFALDLRMERALDFGVRIGINSGEVVVGRIGDDLRMDYTAQGQTVGLAQRMEQIAESGHVYVSECTARLVQGYFTVTDLGRAKVSGVADGGRVFDLDSTTQAHTRLQVSRARGLTAFVGRQDEMDILDKALERARRGRGQVVGVVGEPGLGKSRLCYEFAERCRARGIPVYEGHCPSYGKRIPFIPVLELFRSYFEISARDVPAQARQKIAGSLVLLDPSLQETLPTLFEFLGVGDPARPAPRVEAQTRKRQLFNMLYKVIRAQSERGIVALTFIDDLHWVDDWSDEFIAQMVEFVEHSHVMLLVNYRPEYHAAWSGRAHCQQLPLVPLGQDALREMVASLLGKEVSVATLTDRIMKWTFGNPLFSEEVINTLIETGQLEGQRGAYRLTRDVAELEVPATVHAIIAARVDRLPEDEKALLQAAAVVGKEFSRPLLAHITDLAASEINAAVEHLKSADFIYETAIYPIVEYSFKHPLVHEVAYDTQLRERRARGHAMVAAALEELNAERLDEISARLAYHWESAGDYAHALNWYERAARVSALSDPRSARDHLEKVVACAERLSASADVLAAGARALSTMVTMEWRLGISEEQARSHLEAGLSWARRAGDHDLEAVLLAGYSIARAVGHGHGADAVEYSRRSLAVPRDTSDQELTDALDNWHAWSLLSGGYLVEAAAVWEQVLGRLPDDVGYGARYIAPNLNWSVRGGQAFALVFAGLNTDWEQLRDRFQQYRTDTPEIKAYACSCASWWGALCGAEERPFALAQEGLHWAEQCGTGNALAIALLATSLAHLRRGDFSAAQALATRGLEQAEETGTGLLFSPATASYLALAEIGAGLPEQARDRAASMVAWCKARGTLWVIDPWLALSRANIALGERVAAQRALEDAEQVLERTQSRLYRALVHECRAELAGAFADAGDVLAELAAARAIHESIGATERLVRLNAG